MPFSSTKKRVAVLRGGPSSEYEASLKSGKYVLDNLGEEYEPIDILISRDGVWHQSGFAVEPPKILHSIDVVWNSLHGPYGEDGKVQKLIEHFGVPYTGSSTIASSVGMNKLLAKKLFERAGIKTPYHVSASRGEDERVVFERLHKAMPFPIVIKPSNAGSSLGLTIVNSPRGIAEALEKAFTYSDSILAEEFINGVEVASGVIEDFRDQSHYSLLPSLPRGGTLSGEESSLVQQAAVSLHQALGLKDYSQADFIIHPRRGIFCLEVNTLPKLHEDSGFVSSLLSVGSNIKEFVSHTLKRVLNRTK